MYKCTVSLRVRSVPDIPSSDHKTSPSSSASDTSLGLPWATPIRTYMISTAYYPYPVSDKSSARQFASRPYIYTPSEAHNSPSHTMYPPFNASASPLPTYVYSGYDQYYPKESWAAATPSSWQAFYAEPPRSSSLPEAAVHPKVAVHPSIPALTSDIDTPSSMSSHSVLTPLSPFAQHNVDQMGFQDMDFDEFDYDEDEEEDYVDSDTADEMEGIEEASSLLYGASAPHAIKSTSALEGALGDTVSSYDTATHLAVFPPADRKLSASVHGYPSASHRSSAGIQGSHSPASLTSSSSTLLAPALPPPPPVASQPLYDHHMSSSSLAGAFASSVPPPHASRPTLNPLPILQPQPIRLIPPIPLTDLTSTANEEGSSTAPDPTHSGTSRRLSPLPLLCQPVSDAVRYQLKDRRRPASGSASMGVTGYDDGEDASESMCHPVVPAVAGPFVPQGLTFCQEYPSATGSSAVEGKIYSCGMTMPIRWQ